jgi:predicted glycosyltransferase
MTLTVAVTIQHPAHVHFFKHVVAELRERGHDIHVYAREKDVALDLLDQYDIDHTVLAGTPGSLAGLAATQARYEYQLWVAARRDEPDVLTAIGGTAAAHVSRLVGARSVVWLDNEGVVAHRLTTPFAHAVCTPAWFRGDFGDKHVRYDGFQELAYLHPDRFDPAPDRLRANGVDPDADYSVVRFREWGALHDVGETGFPRPAKRRLVETLAERGDVYVVSERPLPDAFSDHQLPVPPHLVHDLLYYANRYVGDSATMATEAALLGTPAVRCQSFADGEDMSNFETLAAHGLLYSTADSQEAITRAAALAEADVADAWRRRRDRFLDGMTDVVGVAVRVVLREGRRAGGDVSASERRSRERHGPRRRA